MPDAAFATSFDDASSTLWISGDVDELAAGALRDAIAKHSDDFASDLAVDLTRVSYLPSAAIGVLATARVRAGEAERAVELLAADGSIAQRVLAVCGLPYRAP